MGNYPSCDDSVRPPTTTDLQDTFDTIFQDDIDEPVTSLTPQQQRRFLLSIQAEIQRTIRAELTCGTDSEVTSRAGDSSSQCLSDSESVPTEQTEHSNRTDELLTSSTTPNLTWRQNSWPTDQGTVLERYIRPKHKLSSSSNDMAPKKKFLKQYKELGLSDERTIHGVISKSCTPVSDDVVGKAYQPGDDNFIPEASHLNSDIIIADTNYSSNDGIDAKTFHPSSDIRVSNSYRLDNSGTRNFHRHGYNVDTSFHLGEISELRRQGNDSFTTPGRQTAEVKSTAVPFILRNYSDWPQKVSIDQQFVTNRFATDLHDQHNGESINSSLMVRRNAVSRHADVYSYCDQPRYRAGAMPHKMRNLELQHTNNVPAELSHNPTERRGLNTVNRLSYRNGNLSNEYETGAVRVSLVSRVKASETSSSLFCGSEQEHPEELRNLLRRQKWNQRNGTRDTHTEVLRDDMMTLMRHLQTNKLNQSADHRFENRPRIMRSDDSSFRRGGGYRVPEEPLDLSNFKPYYMANCLA